MWHTYIQTHKAIAQFRGKQFKYSDELVAIFGINQTNRSEACDHARVTTVASSDSEFPVDISSGEQPDHTNGESGGEMTSSGTPAAAKKRRLSREEALFAALKDNTAMIVASMDQSIDKLCAAITREGLHDKRVQLSCQLREITTFTAYMGLNAHWIIRCDKDLLDVFTTVEDEDRDEWVHAVLDHYG